MDDYELAKEKRLYLVRNEVLKSIGYATYKEYLDSDEWKAIKQTVKAEYSECICCDKKVEVIHHVKYSSPVMLGLWLQELAPLCHRCHEEIEFTDGKKNRLGQANSKMFEMARRKDSKQKWLMEFYKRDKREFKCDRKVDQEEYRAVSMKLKHLKLAELAKESC